ncbi:putative serine protease K12H4.7 [Trichoplusia ni]|uniref:Serine protease K12H4.7 n=1 Tax=Trichoplusia ni TaxID=7111 RepID=A0A7E5VPK0_TRINI|nr:putative serine protease K12H4.7 [Trichoplusia ni]
MFLQVLILFSMQGFMQGLSSINYGTFPDAFKFEVKLDHFNDSDHRTFNMSYDKDLASFKPGGPVVLHLAPGYDVPHVHAPSKVSGILQEIHPAYFSLEQRYYGSSKPFQNPTVDDLKYLTSKQVLADMAQALKIIKASDKFKNSKVIVYGSTYGATLAVWMKLLYPDLVDAAYASSAPLLAKKDFSEHFEVITKIVKTYVSQDCVDQISAFFKFVQESLQTSEGIAAVKKKFNICPQTDMTVLVNQQILFWRLTERYIFEINMSSYERIKALCQNPILTSPLPLGTKNDTICFEPDYKRVLRDLHQTDSWLWLYQMCTEFGFFRTTTSRNQMFGNNTLPLEFYLKACKAVFGDKFDEQRIDQGILNTNKMFGGLTPNVENTVFVNGDLDPWYQLGVLHDLSPTAPAILISGGMHSRDLVQPCCPPEKDKENVKEAKQRIVNYLKQWIGAKV